MIVTRKRLYAGIAPFAFVAAMSATPAIAQESAVAGAQEAIATGEAPAEDIVVTGSRIRRNPLDQPSPVVLVDSESIARTGLSSIADVLQRIPASAGGLNTKFNNSGNLGNPPDGGGVGAGSAAIDLRYLGAKRTLVLVDGLRYVNGASASGIPGTVDLNSIPDVMIERVEVLQAGASSLYGSDAIGGVVNIITRERQEGLRASAQYGQFFDTNDGETQNYQLSYGVGGSGSPVHIVAGAMYTKQDPVSARDRSISQFPNPGQTSCADPVGGCSSFTPLGRFLVNGQNITLRGPVVGRTPVYDPTLATGDFKAFTAADRFNFAPLNYFLTPNERYGGFINSRVEFSDALNLRVKAVYNHRQSQNQAAFLPLGIGPDVGNGNLLDTIRIDRTNPFNPFDATLVPGLNYTGIFRRLVEAGQRTYSQTVETVSLTGTLDGKFQAFGRDWYWDANAVLGFNDAKQLFTGNVNTQRLQQALGPIAQCTGACVPFNFFGGLGSITPAMLAFVGFDERSRSNQRLQDYTANLSGELFDLPGGPVGIALGYEHRYQYGSFTPDPVIQAGFGADIPAQAARGKFNTDEVYGELRLPILKDVPFFQLLELNGAARYSDYSTFGGNTTLTGGALWKPVRDLLLRGSYAESLRAPSIGELFGAQSRFDQPLSDPCTNIAGSPYQGSATVRANCAADGVPASGSYAEPDGQLPVLTGGNAALDPETARTLIFGAVYSPAWAQRGFVRALSLEFNYYDIKVDNAIAAIPADVLLNRCAQTGDALSCAATTRAPSGIISAINGVLLNTGGIRTKGIDGTFTFRSAETGAGAFGLTVIGNYLLRYAETVPATDGTTVTNYVGTERGSPDQAYPDFKGQAIVDWSIGPVAVSVTGRYIDNVFEAQQPDSELKSRFYTDVQLRVQPSWMDNRLALTIGVNNLFDKDPPACFTCSLNNYDPTTYDVPGQFGYLRVSFGL